MPTFEKYKATNVGFAAHERHAVGVALRVLASYCPKMSNLLSIFGGQTLHGVGKTEWKVKVGKMLSDVFNVSPHLNPFDNERVMTINAVFKNCSSFMRGARLVE